ncbi:MAG TPA: DUF4407 domain-containing protein [Cytophagales bacterium]|jgi:hypothetical protein|nr:DUF4407 domain-containing protein [Cytophagales bacterium]
MKKINSFFLFASGADLQLLEQCPSDKNKYIGIGGTIFFTGLFAALAAGYALFTIFDSYVISILLGLVWGFMIFNLDRFIVSSMRKEERFARELFTALPRILLAIIISLVIAKPIELKIFGKEIESQLVVMEQQVYASQEANAKMRFEPTIIQARQDIQRLQQEVINKTLERNELLKIAQQEADGTGGTKIKNLGPIYKVKKADADRVEAELEALSKSTSSKLVALENRLKESGNQMENVLHELVHAKIDGPAARMEALSRLTDESSAMWWAHIFIIVLFLMIESTPILVKLLSKKGPYDSLVQIAEHKFICLEVESLANSNAETKKRVATLSTSEQNYVSKKLDAELL